MISHTYAETTRGIVLASIGDMSTTTYYHGSRERIERVTDDGLFAGIFFGQSCAVALSHGPIVHTIELDDDDVLTTWLLTCGEVAGGLDDEAVLAAYAAVCDREDLWNYIVCDDDVWDAELGLDADDIAELSWDCQRYRSLLARELGYCAVECSDEHGTTLLVNDRIHECGIELCIVED